MKAEKRAFFKQAVDLLRGLSSDAKPMWGMMTPQHMVEHVVGSWRISNGRARVKPVLEEAEIEKRRAFLFSDSPYAKNIQNPLFDKGLLPLRKESLHEAVDQLENEMDAFFEFHKENPDAVEMHPVFGPLDVDGWLLFQTKHMKHHLAQFGIES